jgi:hypothetical protein
MLDRAREHYVITEDEYTSYAAAAFNDLKVCREDPYGI